MKHAKKLLALLLALALVFALAVPAFAAGESGLAGWAKSLWERVKCGMQEFLIWLGIIKPLLPPDDPEDPCDPDEPFDPDNPPMAEKPVIYLYPEQPTQISVTLQTIDAHLIESIPDYGAGWRVLARPDGALTNLADGEEYPYLFWEAELDAPWPQLEEGFIVAQGDLAGFLADKLQILGLNDAEKDEFIEYWLPRLAGNAYMLIHFAGAYYDNRFPLEISPAPDSLLRVFMVARAAQADERIAPQALQPFERKGFAAVEWGGMIL